MWSNRKQTVAAVAHHSEAYFFCVIGRHRLRERRAFVLSHRSGFGPKVLFPVSEEPIERVCLWKFPVHIGN